MVRARTWVIRVPGVPVPQGRPRAYLSQQRRRIRVYDPAASRQWKQTVATYACTKRPKPLLTGALNLMLCFSLPRPKYPSAQWPTGRPDLSNLVKAIEDALEGMVYDNDSAIVSLLAAKEWAADGDQPSVLITIKEVR